MRNKLKKIWNKEDGFTLVELLGVIVILGIILAIAIPAIGNIITKAEDNTELRQQQLVLDAAQMYFLNEKGETNFKTKVTPKDLVDANYLEAKGTYATDTQTTITEADAESGVWPGTPATANP